ncbi:hypothetical protein [Pseudarthrobacter sp. BIM B-2242]|uniref:hypothetical protein n=1 Tax=Pseudarthrobacter sp. BIM B-2242 TaxID=2772401 RepID=UPI00168BBD20|nr:hypothetical protein [Pseudarthrobacter sp. BIM B-2242]QOD05776.1 hypothetical protein IDT60_22330 [Pseudarthrobacter sp. BIM B-2242]
MTVTPSRQPEGIPIGGQFAATSHKEPGITLGVVERDPVGELIEQQYTAAKDRYEAYEQNAWASDVRRKYPDAAFAYVGVTQDRGGRYTAGMGLYAADGEELDVAEDDQVFFEDTFNVYWDMEVHGGDELNDNAGNSDMFSLDSIKNRWDGFQSSPEPQSDPFAHLTGMERARAQSEYAAQLNREATAAYVQQISAKLLAVNPDFGRLYVNRKADVESGLTFTLDRVEDVHRNVGDVDLTEFEEYGFQDVHLDPFVDCDDATGDLYINLDPGT